MLFWRTVAGMVSLDNSLIKDLIHLPPVWHFRPEVVCIPFIEFNFMHRLIPSINGAILELEFSYIEGTTI